MAIYIIDGKIGSGKTYYAVRHLLKRFYNFDSQTHEWFPSRPHVLVTNIDGLKIDHIDLSEEVRKNGLEGVFSESYVNGLRGSSRLPVIFVIDEAQSPSFFHRKYYNEKVFYFFQYSRHYGVDIYLVTQDSESLSKEIKVLPESTIHAVARSFTTGLSFHYKRMSHGEVSSQFVVKKDQNVFRSYRSFNHDEDDKPKSVVGRYAVFIVVGILIVLISFKYFYLDGLFGGKKARTPEHKITDSSFPVSSSVSVSPKVIEYNTLRKGSSSPVVVLSPSVSPVPVSAPSSLSHILTFKDAEKSCALVVDVILSGDGQDTSLKSFDCPEAILSFRDEKLQKKSEKRPKSVPGAASAMRAGAVPSGDLVYNEKLSD